MSIICDPVHVYMCYYCAIVNVVGTELSFGYCRVFIYVSHSMPHYITNAYNKLYLANMTKNYQDVWYIVTHIWLTSNWGSCLTSLIGFLEAGLPTCSYGLGVAFMHILHYTHKSNLICILAS